MTKLVLDKSMVKAARDGVIADLGSEFDFLLTDVLLQEIMTEDLGERQTLSVDQEARLDAMIHANMRRVTEEAGNCWIEKREALIWEVTEGHSARHAPTRGLLPIPPIRMLLEEGKQACLDHDAGTRPITAFTHAPEEADWLEEVRRICEEEFFTRLVDTFSGDEAVRKIAEDARIDWSEADVFPGLVVSPNFKPTPQWFTFGVTLVRGVFRQWKLWKYRDDPADPKKPENPFYDAMYIAFMAIADGIISADKNLLKLAWACWPDKREYIYDYDMHEHRIILFEPKWSL